MGDLHDVRVVHEEKRTFTGTGAVGEVMNVKGRNFLHFRLDNVGATNVFEVWGKLDKSSTWIKIESFTGAYTTQVLDVNVWGDLKFEVSTYAASGGTPEVEFGLIYLPPLAIFQVGAGNDSATVPPEFAIAIKEGAPCTLHKIIDEPNANLKYEGWSLIDDTENLPIFLIKRTATSGDITYEHFASQRFDRRWDLRGTYFDDPLYTNSRSIQFDGANDRLDVAHVAGLDFDFRSEAFSCALWTKTTNGSQNYIEKQLSNRGYRFWNAASAGRLTLELRGGGTGDRIRVRENATNATLNDGSWHLLAATYDGSGNASGVNLYIDGVAVPGGLHIQNDTLTTTTLNSADLAIGSRSGGGANFQGNIDEPAIWDAELSAADILKIYNAGAATIDLQSAGGTIEGSLIETWRMGDDAGDIYPNIIGIESGYDAVMVNMTAGDIEGSVPGE